jgi:lipopolysaccharide export system permease protein
MKKLDKLLLTSFLGPFVVTFLIAIFVLMMQYLWVYVDDIVGKGAGLFLLIELISYLTVSLVPQALPIAVLISSVMVLGNLAERYELSSMKSAGIPLLRIMLPLMFIAVGISVASFMCSNYLIPVSNLKFKSRLYDIRRQKPTLSIEEGVFNDDFQGFVIRVGRKESDNQTIGDVMIFDQSNQMDNRTSEILAKKGRMYTSDDERFFVMKLEDGNQYFEIQPSYQDGGRNYPFVRTKFREWTKVFDLGGFEIQRTDEELFKSHYSMQSVRQLGVTIDSIDADIGRRKQDFGQNFNRYFEIFKEKAVKKPKVDTLPKGDEELGPEEISVTPQFFVEQKPREQTIDKPLSSYGSLIEIFSGPRKADLVDKAKTLARSILTQAETANRTWEKVAENRVKYIFEMNSKFSFAVACFVFLFIGAPMGAIIRKGGFGYPILVSIIFFMLFIVLLIMCKKLAESNALPASLAAWVPCLVLFPVGLYLTITAMNDARVLNTDRWLPLLQEWFSRRRKHT